MQYTYFHAVNYQADDTILKRLIGAYGILFVCMKIMNVWFGSYWIEEQLALSFSSLCRGKLWTLLTYSFLHATFLHFLFNSLVLYFLGRFLLLYELTPKKLLIIFTGAILSGAVVWLCVHGKHNYLLGASAGVMGLLAYMCHSFPEKTMSVLIFFVFPLQIKARWLIYCTWWYELASCMLYEMQDTSYVAN